MDTIITRIAEGEIKGKVYKTPSDKIYYGFTGIPYAEEPTGNLRFKEPVPMKNWDGIKDVTKDSESFIQYDFKQGIYKGSEKLWINVYTSKLKIQGVKQMPVMVYIHGGGFVGGSGDKAIFGPDFLVEKDVVVASIHYRVGLLGFLCLDIPEAPGNAGLKDQLLALKWVQKNIAVFNGDSSNVTIFGTSAGAASVEYHLLSPQGNGLFHKAIGLSGSAINPWAFQVHPIKNAFEAAKALGKDIKDKKELLHFFISSSAEDLAKATQIVQQEFQKKLNHKGGFAFAFVPVQEKRFSGVSSFLNENPVDVLKSGQQKLIPFINGFCEEEGSLVPCLAPEKFTYAVSQNSIHSLLPFKVNKKAGISNKLDEEYIEKLELGRENIAIRLLSDIDFTGGIMYSAKLHSMKNPNVYLHKFIYNGAYNFIKKMLNITRPKATHADQEGYIGYSLLVSQPGTAEDERCRKRMVEMFTTFAKTGNPTPIKTPLLPTTWEPVQFNKMKCLIIGEELKMAEESVGKLTELWEEVYQYPFA